MSNRLPPYGHFRALSVPLLSGVSDRAFRLWCHVAAHNWDNQGWPVPAANRELDDMLAHLLSCSPRAARTYRMELLDAGFLGESRLPSGDGRLWWALTEAAGSISDLSTQSAPVENFVDNTVDNTVDKSGAWAEFCPNGQEFAQTVGRILPTGSRKKEEVTSEVLNPPPPSLPPEGGVGGTGKNLPTRAEIFPNGQEFAHAPNPVADAPAGIVALLQQRGIYAGTAEKIVERARQFGIGRRELLDLCDQHLRDTGKPELAAWRLMNQPLTAPEAEPVAPRRRANPKADEFRSMLMREEESDGP